MAQLFEDRHLSQNLASLLNFGQTHNAASPGVREIEHMLTAGHHEIGSLFLDQFLADEFVSCLGERELVLLIADLGGRILLRSSSAERLLVSPAAQ
jgi:hypothetical protein